MPDLRVSITPLTRSILNFKRIENVNSVTNQKIRANYQSARAMKQLVISGSLNSFYSAIMYNRTIPIRCCFKENTYLNLKSEWGMSTSTSHEKLMYNQTNYIRYYLTPHLFHFIGMELFPDGIFENIIL